MSSSLLMQRNHMYLPSSYRYVHNCFRWSWFVCPATSRLWPGVSTPHPAYLAAAPLRLEIDEAAPSPLLFVPIGSYMSLVLMSMGTATEMFQIFKAQQSRQSRQTTTFYFLHFLCFEQQYSALAGIATSRWMMSLRAPVVRENVCKRRSSREHSIHY